MPRCSDEANALSTAAEKYGNINKRYGSVKHDAFYELFVGHMRSVAYEPEYSDYIDSKFRKHYINMIRKIDNGDAGAPASLADIIDQIGNGMVGADPDEQMSVEQIREEFLFKEIGRMLRNSNSATTEVRLQSEAGNVFSVVNSENFLTQRRTRREDLEEKFGLAILATVPRIFNNRDVIRRRIRTAATVASVLLALVLTAGFASLSFMGVEKTLELVGLYG